MKKNITMLILALIVAVSAGQLGYAQTSYATTITLDGQSIIKEKNGTTSTIGTGTVVQVTDFQEHIYSNHSADDYNRILVKNGMIFEVEFPSHYTNIEKDDGPFTIITTNGKSRIRFTGAGGFSCSYKTVVGGVQQNRQITGDVNYYGVLQIDIPGMSATQDAPDKLAVVSSGDPRIGQVISGFHYVAENQVLSVPNSAFGASEWNISLENPENFVLLQENIYTMKLQDILLQTEDKVSSRNKTFKLKVFFGDRTSNALPGLIPGGISHHQITLKDERITDKKVASIQLSPSQLSLTKGETAHITANILPQDASNKELTWHSSNPLVHVDEQGKVQIMGTPTQESSVTISATAKDGSNVVGNMTVTVQPEQFTVTAESNNTAWGTVNPATQTVNANTQVTVTATAQQGFNFVGWFENGNLVHNQSAYTFNVTANRTLEARFAAQPKPKFTITTSVKDNLGGSASPQAQEIEQGQAATVTATAQQGFNFVGWFENGNLVHNQTTYTFNVTANRTLEARFNEVINPKNLLPHLKNFGSAPFKKGQQYEPFIWEEMIPNANPNSFKIIVINSTSSTILESNNYSVTKNDQEGLSISFKQTGKFTVTIQFEAEGQSYFVSYDIEVVE